MAKKKTETAATYRVAGPNVVLGHEPGETFEALLEPILEERLVSSGNLERVDPSASTTTETPGGTEAADKKE